MPAPQSPRQVCDIEGALAPRPFRAMGYPVAPAIFMAASLAIVTNAIYRDPGTVLRGVGAMALGVPLYAWLVLRRRDS